MDVNHGYKLTEVGEIPEDWRSVTIGQLSPYVTSGSRGWARYYAQDGAVFIRITNLTRTTIYPNLSDLRFVKLPDNEGEGIRTSLQEGDVLISITADIGIVGFVAKTFPIPSYINQHIALVRLPKSAANAKFVAYFLASAGPQGLFQQLVDGGAKAGLNLATVRRVPLCLPPTKAEQEAIANALSDADALIESLERLLAKKRLIKQGAMEDLLTGRRRLPGFEGEWLTYSIRDIAQSVSEYNRASQNLPVLTCSKHYGFVDSLKFFVNQVFSADTSGYKVIRLGQIGYPANHIEEGSIGLQDLYSAALVSPIYIVFQVSEGFSSYFIHRLLKLNSYRHQFEAATNSSVARRGSLRWPEFSQMKVKLPDLREQEVIAAILSTFEREISTLEDKLRKTQLIKQGMMKSLLTGRIRLV